MPYRQANGIYAVDRTVTVNGVSQRIAHSLKTTNKDLAKKLEQKEVDEVFAALMGEKKVGPVPTFGEFVTEWKLKARGRYTGRERTWEFIEDRLKSIQTFEPLVKARLHQIDKALLTDFEDHKRISQISNVTLNRDFGVIRLILRQAVDRGHKLDLPEFPHYPERRHDRVVTTKEEEIYAAKAANHHRVFFKVAIDTAMEPGVIAALAWPDVQFDADQDHKHGYIHARGTKAHFGVTTYRDRIVPMTSRLRHLLMERWLSAGRPTEGWVFPAAKVEEHTPLATFKTSHKRLFGRSISPYKPRATTKSRKLIKKEKPKKEYLKIPYFRLYDLRHTALTRMAESGMSEIELMKIAGWSSTAMAARYVHPSKRRIAKAVERFEQHLNQGIAGD